MLEFAGIVPWILESGAHSPVAIGENNGILARRVHQHTRFEGLAVVRRRRNYRVRAHLIVDNRCEDIHCEPREHAHAVGVAHIVQVQVVTLGRAIIPVRVVHLGLEFVT